MYSSAGVNNSNRYYILEHVLQLNAVNHRYADEACRWLRTHDCYMCYEEGTRFRHGDINKDYVTCEGEGAS